MNEKMKELGNVLAKANELFEEIKKTAGQEVKRGNIVTVSGIEWLILKVDGIKVHCVMKDFYAENTQFDSEMNNWSSSDIREYLNTTFFKKITEEVAEDDILPIATDMLSLDGQTEYGKCTDKVSLLTVDLYRENRDILPNTEKWWWLATPWSTPCNDYSTGVCVVSSGGNVDNYDCYGGNAVRPFCIFDSSIFGSSEDEDKWEF